MSARAPAAPTTEDVLGREVERVEARGPLCVLLHGYTGRPRAWREVASSLGAGGFASAALGVFGHGPRGRRMVVPASFDDEVDHLARIIDVLVSPRADDGVVLVGYSLGARLALRLAVQRPSHVSRLLLVSGSPGLEDGAERDARRDADRRWIDALRTEGLARFADDWAAQPVLRSHRTIPVDRLTEHHAMRRDHDAEGLARAMEVLGLAEMPDTWPALASLAMPVVLVVGEHDAKFRAINTRMATLVARSRLVVIPAAGHDLVLEAPEHLAHLVVDAGGLSAG